MIEYALTRSRRKSIAIHITKDATVEVRAPLNVPKSALDSFVASKEGWIVKNVERRRLQLAKMAGFTLDYGSRALLLGREYTLEPEGNRPKFEGGRLCIPAGLSREQIKPAVVAAYRVKAREILNEKVARFSAVMGVSPCSVRISGAKTRWGSCSGKNGVTFSWRLVMADEETVDYVVVHELAHIIEHNHSQRFWAVVAGIMPDYAKQRARLKLLHGKLQQENWDY